MRLCLPAALSFGAGALGDLGEVLGTLGVARPLVVTDAGVAAAGAAGRVEALLRAAGLAVESWPGALPEPAEEHADACGQRLAAGAHDGVVAVGGGSVIDVAKVGAVLATCGGRTADYFGFDRVARPGLPVVAVPTTPCSGAEVSSHAVLWSHALRRKHVVGSPHLVPRAAVVDPELAATLPAERAIWCALDGLIHAVEALMARRASPVTDALARLGLASLVAGLPRLHSDGGDAAAREQVVLGSLYAGLAMANASAGAIHALGYPLTGRHGVPHGLANALVAASTLERTWRGFPERAAELARMVSGQLAAGAPGGDGAAGAAELPQRMRAFLGRVGVAAGLADWGVDEAELPEMASEASQFRPVLDNTPVALGTADLLAIYRDCFSG